MGRYKKSKISGDVPLLELPPSLGVRTRAKTLALQRLQSDSSSFLQLRNRRLQKPVFNKHEDDKVENNTHEKSSFETEEPCFDDKAEFFEGKCEFQGSCGENCLDFETRERSTRESTPCSLVRDSETVATPGSSTRLRNSTAIYQRQSIIQRHIPTAREMEDFFAFAEQQQQKLFMEKYNFDILNDLPLAGRYEWIPVNP